MSRHATAAGVESSPVYRPLSRISTRAVANGALWVAVFISGFVLQEPAPYELYMLALVAIWALFGLTLRSGFGPMIVCYLIYIAGGLLSATVATELGQASMYVAVSGFLAVTAIFYAAVIAADPQRLAIVRSAYIASAFVVAVIGILGYFGAIPGADLFTLYDRAKGTFQDPNVFGPFLVLPMAFLIRDLFTRPLARNIGPLLIVLVLALGVLLSFSRAAWGLLAFTALALYLLVFINELRPAQRARLIVLGFIGAATLATLLALALSFESIGDMFQERAKLVQDYDASRLGRFARHAIGFEMVMERPLGLGALEFRNFFPEDEHNSYLKGFTSYGWLGGIAYIALILWTLAKLFPLQFQPRPWQPYAQCLFVVLFGHTLIAVVIDTDHWRHMYMLIGLSWGLIAHEGMLRRQTPLHRKIVHRQTSALARQARSV